MKTLLIFRHAKSSWKDVYLADHDRPLNKRGKRDAPRMGRFLREEGLVPDLIISSSAKRALATAELFVTEAGYEDDVEVTRAFYHAYPEEYVERLQALPDDYMRVMVIGHNPGLAELLAELTGDDEPMPTAAVAWVELPIRQWRELSLDTDGRLVQLWRPRELP